MKKVLLFVAMACGISLASFAQTTTTTPAATTPVAAPAPNPNAGEFTFKEETWDFENIPQGTPVTHTFAFTNTGKEPIVISNVRPSCQCTTPKWPKEPILPGKTADIDVQFNAAHEGGFSKTVTITSNAATPTKMLYIKGSVLANHNLTTPDKQPVIISTTPKN